jgi:hypothetical protein
MDALLSWAHVKKLYEELPEKNAWDRRFPHKRAYNLATKWNAKLLSVCPAPLPKDEFIRLQKYAKGEALPDPPLRKSQLENKVILEGTTDIKLTTPKGERPHEMTPRAWRRIWQKILDISPVLNFNSSENKWEVISDSPGPIRPTGNPDEFSDE